jgi:UDP-glucose 4-epimerase
VHTKLVVERMLKDADATYGIRHVALRYFNEAGADPDGAASCTNRKRTSSIKIFGNDYSTPVGTCIRDYAHVSDLADAHVAAVDWLAAGKPSDSFNLGTAAAFRLPRW